MIVSPLSKAVDSLNRSPNCKPPISCGTGSKKHNVPILAENLANVWFQIGDLLGISKAKFYYFTFWHTC
jgi:hypothetical protein